MPQQQQQSPQQQCSPPVSHASTAAAAPAAGVHTCPAPCNGVFFIQDVLVWRGYSLIDCGADFRLFWLQSKLQEEQQQLPVTKPGADGAAPAAADQGLQQLQQQTDLRCVM
jgi:hypothetical protein